MLDRIDDAVIVQLYADGFTSLTPRERILIWHLCQAGLAGRDIYYDQRHPRALAMRRVIDAVMARRADIAPAMAAADWQEIERYAKLFWINNGPYVSGTGRKFVLRTTPAAFRQAAAAAGVDRQLDGLEPMFFDPDVDPLVTCKAPGRGQDVLAASANNLYAGVTMADLEGFAERYPLNSRLVKRRDGTLEEEVYRVGGRSGDRVAAIIRHLDAAIAHAPPATAEALAALVRWYRTGEEDDRREYDIAWVRDRASRVDTVNGFVEFHMDARGVKGAWEALVFYASEKTVALERLAASAQWFEDRLPCSPEFRRPQVVGTSARAMDVVFTCGDAGPTPPLGINLPNDPGIRQTHGSKSAWLSNVADTLERSLPPAFWIEFASSAAEAERATRWGPLVREVEVCLHEVIGHASGRVSERLASTPQDALREHYSTIEEARADLVSLYFLGDPQIAEIGLVAPSDHAEIALAGYEAFTRMALLQLRYIRTGCEIEQDHIRSHHLIVGWLADHTGSIVVERRGERTFFVLRDAGSFRAGVARLFAEIQRIKSEGDYRAASALVERYGARFDPALRDEVVARADRLHVRTYAGYVMPTLTPVVNERGEMVDVAISYSHDFVGQMLEYGGVPAAGS